MAKLSSSIGFVQSLAKKEIHSLEKLCHLLENHCLGQSRTVCHCLYAMVDFWSVMENTSTSEGLQLVASIRELLLPYQDRIPKLEMDFRQWLRDNPKTEGVDPTEVTKLYGRSLTKDQPLVVDVQTDLGIIRCTLDEHDTCISMRLIDID